MRLLPARGVLSGFALTDQCSQLLLECLNCDRWAHVFVPQIVQLHVFWRFLAGGGGGVATLSTGGRATSIQPSHISMSQLPNVGQR